MVTNATRLRRLILVAILVAAAAAAFHWGRRALAIDRCLDGGGQWNFEAATCITTAAEIR